MYDELRAIAGAMLNNQRKNHTLQPTALVNEAYVRLQPRLRSTSFTREQLLALAARAMRTILIDHARSKNRQKRGGGRARFTLTDQPLDASPVVEILAIDEALSRLASFSERKARLVECRCFAGMTISECATALGIARSTATEDWKFAKAWLSKELRRET